MVRAILVVAFLAASVPGSAVRADILPLGHVSCDHDYVFDGLDAFPDYRFFILDEGTFFLRDRREVKPGQPVSWHKHARPRLCAVRATPGEESGLSGPIAARSEETFPIQDNYPAKLAARRILTRVKVGSIEGGRIVLAGIESEYFDGKGHPVSADTPSGSVKRLVVGLSILTAALFGLVLFIRGRRTAAGAPRP